MVKYYWEPDHPGKAHCSECGKHIPSQEIRLARAESHGHQVWTRYFCSNCGKQLLLEKAKELIELASPQVEAITEFINEV